MELSGDSDEFTNTMALGSSLIMRIATFWLLAVPGAALLLTPTSLAPAQSVIALRTPPEPRALLAETPTAAMAAVTSAATALPPTSLLLAADDVFGEVFMAGMSIAFAAVGATVLAGVIIRGKYDEIEKSMFDAQDEQSDRDAVSDNKKSATSVDDFFGETVPRPTSKPTKAE